MIIKKSLLLALSVFTSSGSLAHSHALDPEPIDWQPCGFGHHPALECARYPVPLSYSSPFGAKITISLIRQPAFNSDMRKGSLFLNPGGPGGSGVQMLVNAGQHLFTAEVRESYDLIGFDPRGTNASTPLGCLQTQEEVALLSDQPPFPVSRREEKQKIGLDAYLNLSCLDQANRIIDHMSTADVARDMDLLRRAVGDEQLNFYGTSYGSILGMTYANLFPERVGAMVIDGVLDPVSWSTGRGRQAFLVPATNRIGGDAAAKATLKEFFRLCDQVGPARCALSGNAEDRFARLMATLEKRPQVIQLPDGSSFQLTYQEAVVTTLQHLYMSHSWQEFSRQLSDLEDLMAGEPVDAHGSTFMPRPIEPTNGAIDQQLVQFIGVLCADTDNPRVPSLWPVAAHKAEREHGYFGRFWTWAGSACAGWIGAQSDRYAGPYSRPTANTVLVVNTLFDPATSYDGAVSAANTLGSAVLLTVEGWGHTSAGLSYCADRAIADYLLYNELPETGTACKQDLSPFPEPIEPLNVVAVEMAEQNVGNNLRVPSNRQHVGAQGSAARDSDLRGQARSRRERILRETLRALEARMGAR